MRSKVTHSSKISIGMKFRRAAWILHRHVTRLRNIKSSTNHSTAPRSRRGRSSKIYRRRTAARPSAWKAGRSSSETIPNNKNYMGSKRSLKNKLIHRVLGVPTPTTSGETPLIVKNSLITRVRPSNEVKTTNISEERRNERLRKAIELLYD